MRRLLKIYIILSLCTITVCGVYAQKRGGQNKPEKRDHPITTFDTTTPPHDFDLLLNSPTSTTISVSVVMHHDAECYIICNGKRVELGKFRQGEAKNIPLVGLNSGKENQYSLHYKLAGEAEYKSSESYTFYTPSAKCDRFCFTVIADSHLDENCAPDTYIATLGEAAKRKPRFHIDLGDTFMVDKYRDDFRQAKSQYMAQRYYFGKICASAPLLLVIGNHDGESSSSRNGMTEWARAEREALYPPIRERNYYSQEWGNTLIITLDPYGFSPKEGKSDPWARTLGKEQYDWLKSTLANSKAEHKFIFIHNLVGGVDVNGRERGGKEVSHLYEWGGESKSGEYEFDHYRKGWQYPIHEVMKRYGVKALFHGHDHVYAAQERDGIAYICVPQPGSRNRRGNTEYAKEYGYTSGTIRNQPGFMLVEIDGKSAEVNYILSDGTVSDAL